MSHRGFSLFELMFTLAIAVIIAFAAVPAMGRLVLDARLTADVNAFVTAIQLARSESAKRGANVVVCKTADDRVCGGSAVNYEAGWMVFVDADGDDQPEVDRTETVLWTYRPSTGGTIRSNRSRYVFSPYYRRSTNGTVTFCDRRGAAAARAVIVSYTGRPRASDRGPGGRKLECLSADEPPPSATRRQASTDYRAPWYSRVRSPYIRRSWAGEPREDSRYTSCSSRCSSRASF